MDVEQFYYKLEQYEEIEWHITKKFVPATGDTIF